MRNIRFEKKTAVIILIVTIGLSLFGGIVSAAAGGNPVSSLLGMVQDIQTTVNNIKTVVNGIATGLGNIDTKIDDMATDLDAIQTDLGKTTQIIGYYSGGDWIEGGDSRWIVGSTVYTDKPALFTVSFITTLFADGYVHVDRFEPDSAYWVAVKWSIPEPDQDGSPFIQDTFTFAGQGISISIVNDNSYDVTLYFTIMIQGSPDTVITIPS